MHLLHLSGRYPWGVLAITLQKSKYSASGGRKMQNFRPVKLADILAVSK